MGTNGPTSWNTTWRTSAIRWSASCPARVCWSTELYPIAEECCPILQQLDGKVVSGYVRLRKPHRDIYEYALREFGIDPSTAVFIDDKAMNIVGANAAGIRGVRFSDPRRLRELLIEAGVNIPAVA